MSPRRTTKEPTLSPASPIAPVVAQLQAMIAAATSATTVEAADFVEGRVDGLRSAITLLVRAGATTVTNNDGQKLVKLERQAPERDEVALLDKRLDDLAARVHALEELSPSLKPKTTTPTKPLPAILTTPTDDKPGKCARALLHVLATRSGSPTTVAQLARLSKYSETSSSFTHALGWLRRASWVNGPPTDLRVTTTGMQNAPRAQLAPRSGGALVDYWCAVLSKGERAMLSAIATHGRLTLIGLANETGYSPTSSSFTHAIGALRKLGLVQPGWPAQGCDAIANGDR